MGLEEMMKARMDDSTGAFIVSPLRGHRQQRHANCIVRNDEQPSHTVQNTDDGLQTSPSPSGKRGVVVGGTFVLGGRR